MSAVMVPTEGPEAEAAEGGLGNLEHWTLKTQDLHRRAPDWDGSPDEPREGDRWCCTIHDFGGGELEITSAFAADGWKDRLRGAEAARKAKKKRQAEELEGVRTPRIAPIDPDPANIERSLRRTRKQIRHLVHMMDADQLVTLTTRAAVVDHEAFGRMIRAFLQKVRRKYPEFQYVLVQERHDGESTSVRKRFSLHAHFAMRGFYNYNTLRKFWREAVQLELKDGDYVGAGLNAQRRKGYTNRAIMARYMAKYASKDIAMGEACRKRYWASKNIQRPLRRRVYFGASIHPPSFFRAAMEHITGVRLPYVFIPSVADCGSVSILYYSTG